MLTRDPASAVRVLHGPLHIVDIDSESYRLRREMKAAAVPRDTITLLKTDGLSVLMIVLNAGASIEDHAAPAPITITPLEGALRFFTEDRGATIGPGDVVGCDAGVRHTIEAESDSVFLLHVGPKPGQVPARTTLAEVPLPPSA